MIEISLINIRHAFMMWAFFNRMFSTSTGHHYYGLKRHIAFN
jgi:hypothetical protein